MSQPPNLLHLGELDGLNMMSSRLSVPSVDIRPLPLSKSKAEREAEAATSRSRWMATTRRFRAK